MTARGRPALDRVHDVHASAAQFTVFGIGCAYEQAAERIKPMIEKVAHALAGADDQFREDLVQEGLVAIWDLHPSRFDAAGETPRRSRTSEQLCATDEGGREHNDA